MISFLLNADHTAAESTASAAAAAGTCAFEYGIYLIFFIDNTKKNGAAAGTCAFEYGI